MVSRVLALVLALWASGTGAQELSGLARATSDGSAIGDVFWGGARVDLALSQGVPFRAYVVGSPNRLVLDFQEVDFSQVTSEDLLKVGRISDVRFGSVQPGWSRLVADLAQPLVPESIFMTVDDTDGRAKLSVILAKATQEAFDSRAGAPHSDEWREPAIVAGPKSTSTTQVIVIDPGHGGIDPGAENGGVHEAELMLTLAAELRDTLRRVEGLDVYLTRDADYFVSLEARIALSKAVSADVFISLHADALKEGTARGATVYTLADSATDAASTALAERHDRGDILAGVDLRKSDDRVAGVLLDLARLENQPRSQALARHLVDGIRNATGVVHKRPLREAGFSVLKAADVPSVLIEVGFLSTDADLENLQDPMWRAGLAAGIRDGIQAWLIDDAANEPLRRQ